MRVTGSKTTIFFRLAAACILIYAGTLHADIQNDLGIMLIPEPAKLERGEGFFTINGETAIAAGEGARKVAEALRQCLSETTGMALALGELTEALSGEQAGKLAGDLDPQEVMEAVPPNTIFLGLIPLGEETSRVRDSLEFREGYRLLITRDRIAILAQNRAGLFYGVQTLRQLLPMKTVIGLPADRIRWVLPCLSIEDAPRFGWRGLMLDCSRTFQSAEFIRKTIDCMAFYKLNVLHLHLTDDQGWRLEIKKYPELTAKGARFPEKYGDPDSHQGFYTREQMKELVRYAAARNVTIVPEIEMPGHALAALSCFPELSCTGGPFEIFPFFKGPGITKDIFCAGNEKTFEFLENVLAEVIEIFPSRFIHIGGDEAPKERWRECPRCQAVIRGKKLTDEHELQSDFIKRIEKIVNARGRVLIGWDEILEGGLAPNAAVMSWRGTKGGIAAAQAGHDVVMSPTSHCYFDYPYKRIDTRRAYSFEPVPAELDESHAERILGLQANFWSHIDREPEKVESQLFPRLLAIAERGWSPKDVRAFDDFQWRAKAHLVHLDDMDVHYRRPPAEPPIAPVGRWSPEEMSEKYKPLAWDVTAKIAGAGRYRVRFLYTRGSHRLGIEKCELLADGAPVSIDAHRGVTGNRHLDNEYVVTLEDYRSGTRYVLRASARSEGGTDSNGEVYLIKED